MNRLLNMRTWDDNGSNFSITVYIYIYIVCIWTLQRQTKTGPCQNWILIFWILLGVLIHSIHLFYIPMWQKMIYMVIPIGSGNVNRKPDWNLNMHENPWTSHIPSTSGWWYICLYICICIYIYYIYPNTWIQNMDASTSPTKPKNAPFRTWVMNSSKAASMPAVARFMEDMWGW